jgi:predicted transposase YdaD
LNIEFIEIFEQSNPEEEMATKFKTVFEVAEERGRAEERERSEIKMRKALILIIRTTTLTNAQIANDMDIPIEIVEKTRKDISSWI